MGTNLQTFPEHKYQENKTFIKIFHSKEEKGEFQISRVRRDFLKSGGTFVMLSLSQVSEYFSTGPEAGGGRNKFLTFYNDLLNNFTFK